MSVVSSFLASHLKQVDINKYASPRVPNPVGGKELCLDIPIKAFDRFVALIMTRMRWMNYGGFTVSVANEAGAIIAALLAVGYSFDEVIELVASGELDIGTLIEGKTKLPSRLHSKLHLRHSGAMHKGHRLRDRVGELLRAKLPGSPDTPVTFSELFNSKRKRLVITVINLETGGIVPLSKDNYPGMAVADAVLASCAVQPYIQPFEHKVDKKTSTRFIGCGNVLSLPLEVLIADRQARRASGDLADIVVAFGSKSQENLAATESATGSEVLRVMQGQRAAPVIPDVLRKVVILL